MKKKVSALVKQIIAAVSSIAKNKTLALRSKTRAIKTRIIIFSLLNRRFVMSCISHKLQALLGQQQQQQHHYPESDDDDHQEDQDQSKGKAGALVVNPSSSNNDIINVVVSHRSHQHQPVDLIINPTDDDHIHMTADSEDNIDIDDDINHGYLHHLVEAQAQAGDHHLDVDRYCEEEDQFESVIDIVKNSKQRAGQEFSLEDDIDHVADLFIRRFHRQITIQKQHSFKSKRHQ
ncbi:PREDICTED: cotton fiber [Prunus dulcis]|uniref:PREDICTED: cotton fiber n=1 Tax=Prunus dulcis TaxID=3755 RepID=A0A5E4G7M9_PRUDU|nr:uncharacterized protein LOC117612474 [Prunus dulcis]VVA35787.1 PREDICTED: cotton fiber [Prunus dulcis]